MKNEKRIIENQHLKRFGYFLYTSYIIIARVIHKIIKPRPKKINLIGKEIIISNNLQYLFFWNKNYENYTYKIFDRYLDPAHSYIDIGAFIGSTVLYGANIAKKVYAIEPDPIAFSELKRNVSLNPNLKDKIEIHQKCINNKSGQVRFGNIAKGGDSTSSLQFSDSKTSWIVDGVTFEEFIEKNNIKNCNFIKMDIEGGEAIVLPSMKDFLEKNKPILYLSMHPIFFKDAVEDTKKIIKVLNIYKNIFTDSGQKISLDDLLSKKRLRSRYAILAMDDEFN